MIFPKSKACAYDLIMLTISIELSIFRGLHSWRSIGSRVAHLNDLLLRRLQNLERANQILVNTHECSWIIELSTVVGGWEYSKKHPFCEKLVALFYNLVSPADEVEIVFFTKNLNVIRPESKRNSSLILTPTLSVLIRVRPQQIAKQTSIMSEVPVSGTSVGFSIFLICSMDSNSGDNPPCMQRMRSSIKAATGRQLKQSMKSFQSLMLYRRLPECWKSYIRHRIRRFCWLMNISGFLSIRRNFAGIWFCMPSAGKSFQVKICLYRRNLPERGSLTREGICRGRRVWANQDTGHEYLLNIELLTTDFERSFKLEEDGLLHEYFFRFLAEASNLGLEEVDLFGHFRVFDREQFFDDVVNVYLYLALHYIIV